MLVFSIGMAVSLLACTGPSCFPRHEVVCCLHRAVELLQPSPLPPPSGSATPIPLRRITRVAGEDHSDPSSEPPTGPSTEVNTVHKAVQKHYYIMCLHIIHSCPSPCSSPSTLFTLSHRHTHHTCRAGSRPDR